MNRIDQLIQNKKDILSIYFTAGYPKLNDTLEILQNLELAGVDLVEIGIPFSDPLADGPTIQASNQQALKNGMTLSLLFEQLSELRKTVRIPVILMGYLNSILQFGEQHFVKQCSKIGVDGLILPDLTMDYYAEYLQPAFEANNLKHIMLVTPSSSDERIRSIDQYSSGFIYAVSTHSITGTKLQEMNAAYFRRLKDLKLKNKHLIGFGIHDQQSFERACKNGNGGIIGSAFIKHLKAHGPSQQRIHQFVKTIQP
ncbi:tryptophan synthase subunit alpha [Parvicella tangerina]|uniref:Tryptophan synthase alpha chain n=1 Tax=Parvicella tangerina TaxID=2829795 RepID=A0A916NHW2_9FLAO|nr:tryptophan synthase subunit alpha [Parvicella tangerina]CAG5083925.1 Tryptophan synthase alpha chain [Parvicella tangerina]